MIDNHLKIIDFSAALKSEPLNFNYNVVKGWVDRERLRTGGYGLVEGFDLEYTENLNVNISDGILINKIGEEVIVPGKSFIFDPPPYEKITERVRVDNDGYAILKFKPYSPSLMRTISKNAALEVPYKDSELQAEDVEGLYGHIKIITVDGNKIGVTAKAAGIILSVTYYYANDRIDAVMIDADANWSIEQGINSETPSVANINLGPRFLIAFVHWMVKDTISVEFIIDERTYRKVYVDKLNRLYLNGKLYQEAKFIYFTEPSNPDENDVWYDHKSNTLNIWSKQDGAYGWRIINDFTNVPLRIIKTWTPDNFPKDKQTFMFGDDELQYRYIPNTNAVEIIIDQQTVMNDQFTEIVQPGSKPYLSSGIGFRLNQPLDRATVVECIIHHTVKNEPLKNVFQRAAIFTNENFHAYSANNISKIFETDLPYVIGAEQLEVFVNGARMNRGTDFVEMVSTVKEATADDKDTTTTYFKILRSLSVGAIVTYKISRYVWSYDQLNEMVSEIEQKADDAGDLAKHNQQDIVVLSNNVNTELTAIKSRLYAVEKTIATLPKYRKKNELIQLNDLAADIKSKLVQNTQIIKFNASDIASNRISNYKAIDYVIVICETLDDGAKVLIKGTDYILRDDGNGNAIIDLESEWMSPDNTIYVQTLRIGR